MGIYFQKGRGWKADFTLNGRRYTSRYFKTKREAKQAEITKKGGDSEPGAGEAGGDNPNRHGLLRPGE